MKTRHSASDGPSGLLSRNILILALLLVILGTVLQHFFIEPVLNDFFPSSDSIELVEKDNNMLIKKLAECNKEKNSLAQQPPCS